MMKVSVFYFAILAALVSQALACSCARTTFEENYCRSETSVRVKVLAKTDNCPGTCDPFEDQVNGKITYILKVIKLFKGVEIEDDVMFGTTAVNGGLCGVTLQVGKEYLLNIGGPEVDGSSCPSTTYSLNICQFPELWTGLTNAQKKFVLTNSATNDSLCT